MAPNQCGRSGPGECVRRLTKGLRLDAVDVYGAERMRLVWTGPKASCFPLRAQRDCTARRSRWVWAKPSEAARGRGSATCLSPTLRLTIAALLFTRTCPTGACIHDERHPQIALVPDTDPAPLPSLLTQQNTTSPEALPAASPLVVSAGSLDAKLADGKSKAELYSREARCGAAGAHRRLTRREPEMPIVAVAIGGCPGSNIEAGGVRPCARWSQP
jgi:hypothetical protein